jgi:outer membrane cobalamin receptor
LCKKTIKEKRFETLGEFFENEVGGIDFKNNGATGANTNVSIRVVSSLQTSVLAGYRYDEYY